MNICKHCKKNFKVHKSKQNKTTTSTRSICGSCSVSKRRWKSKIQLVESLGGKCNRCGFNGHPGAFHFHHINAELKNHEINANKLLTKDRWDEIKKCELLCANCHCIEHSNTELIKSFGLIT